MQPGTPNPAYPRTLILKMCMKKFGLKKIFLDKHFNVAIFGQMYLVNNGRSCILGVINSS